MKLAQLFKEHTDADVTIFYMDIRAPGKGCEEFYDKSLREGICFVRGRVAEVTDKPFGRLEIWLEDVRAEKEANSASPASAAPAAAPMISSAPATMNFTGP